MNLSWPRLRAAFLAGLLVTVPIGVTLAVLYLLVSWVDALQPQLITGRPIPGLGILLVTLGVLGVGLATQHWFGARLVNTYEGLLARVPVLSSVYGGVKQVVEAAVSQGSHSVRGVVLVQWPRAGLWSIGFHTGEGFIVGDDGARFLNVFLPSTPNPTTGFYFLAREDEVVKTELSVEEAAKILMSAGLVGPETPIVVPASQLPGHPEAIRVHAATTSS